LNPDGRFPSHMPFAVMLPPASQPMTDAPTARFVRYLAAKRSVDDRALNARVAHSFRAALPRSSPEAPLRVLEVGAGIGTMIERLFEWHFASDAVITAVDEQEALLSEARRRLSHLGRALGYDMSGSGPASLDLRRGGHLIRVEFVATEVLEFARARRDQREWDVLLAHAFLDLVDLHTALAALTGLLRDRALLYLTINFDGATQFLPEIDQTLDAKIETLYHRTMDRRMRDGRGSGDSHTGRRLFQALPAVGAEILEAGSSDWLVFANRSGYPADEGFFLSWILDSHESALRGCKELDAPRLGGWIAERRRQAERGELIYITHQLDFLARMTGGRPGEL
jgi:SAM-dependent methyltransferase